VNSSGMGTKNDNFGGTVEQFGITSMRTHPVEKHCR
jgi:hypothetical protein